MLAAEALRDVLAHVLGQDLVDERLIAHSTSARFLSELVENSWVYADRNQLARAVAQRWPSNAPHRPQLLGRRIWNVREINLAPCTPHARGDSRVGR